MKSIASVIVLILVVLLTGCATLFSATTDTVSFTTDIENVDVHIDGQFMGKTPLELTLSRSLMGGAKNEVSFSKTGYKSQTFLLKKEFETVAILNTTSITSWAVDLLTGAMLKYSPGKYFIQMQHESESTTSLDYHLKRNFYLFVFINYDNLIRDLTVGDGPFLDSLVDRIANSKLQKNAIKNRVLENQIRLLSTLEPMEIVTVLSQDMKKDSYFLASLNKNMLL